VTLIVAQKADKGVIVASDSQATVATQILTRQDAEKLFCLGERIVWGSAGAVGIAQRVGEALEAGLGRDKAKCQAALATLRPIIRRIVGKVLKEGQESFIPTAQQKDWIGNAFLFAGHTGGSPWILEITANGADIEHDPHAAIGSADVFSYFAQASMQHLPLRQPSQQVAELAVYRTVDTACRVSGFGISLPVRMWYATDKGCHELTQAEVDGIRDSVSLWKQFEADLLPQIVGTGETEATK
jgi:20S proteasome alpha/beta subunit